ncbi:hypothetical protein Y032_0098g3059 [Ancylostoma ceylanicum]|uniref:Uncharacterized protein n=1 Tax=Ancylostoma ceylanicum TaxID=53326 RepID=A0A016TI88_9BILA|nr:hypothetical protein Y032_0098g3059 [Ancylostoma ceylanicum]
MYKNAPTGSTASASEGMAAFVLLLAVIAAAEACAPTTPTTVTTGRKRRAAEVVLVTVVTNQKYKPSMNDAHLQTMKALLNDYTTSKKVVYDKRMVHERPSNVGGRFAVVYTVRNADCGQVSDFARGARRQANFITRMGVKCRGRPEVPIN